MTLLASKLFKGININADDLLNANEIYRSFQIISQTRSKENIEAEFQKLDAEKIDIDQFYYNILAVQISRVKL
jgi:Ca2+-binding EF-hand superfamily protein